jgi:hypothetical protein
MPSLRIELAAFALLLALVTGTPTAQDKRILVQSSPLAGFQYYAGGLRWSEMRVGDVLKLVREPDNPHDANAIRVEWHGEKFGYLPRAENRAVAAEMDRGGHIEARIAQLREHRNPWKGS